MLQSTIFHDFLSKIPPSSLRMRAIFVSMCSEGGMCAACTERCGAGDGAWTHEFSHFRSRSVGLLICQSAHGFRYSGPAMKGVSYY